MPSEYLIGLILGFLGGVGLGLGIGKGLWNWGYCGHHVEWWRGRDEEYDRARRREG